MASSDSPSRGVLLTKEERKRLLARLERDTRKAEPPTQTVRRAEEALREGNLAQARRLYQHLKTVAPTTARLNELAQAIQAAEREEKKVANVAATEEMLVGYIQQRKKQLAMFALQTLVEVAPDHPRRQEYEVWVADLDQEVELQRRLDAEVEAGRAALHRGDLDRARHHLDALRKVDPAAHGTEALAEEIEQAEAGQARSADVGRLKVRIEELLSSGETDAAEREIEALAGMGVPKITLDFLWQRLDQARGLARDEAEQEALRIRFQRHMEARDWQNARDLAKRFGERFPASDEPAKMFREVNELEARQRRRQSVEQGIATLEKFIGGGQRREAEMVLKVLRGLDVDPAQLRELEERVARL